MRERCGSAERDSAAAGVYAGRAGELQKLLDAVVGERDSAAREAAGLRPVADRVTTLEAQLIALRTEKDELAAAKAGFERGEAERRDAYDAQLKQVKELEAKLETRFGELAGKALETAHDAFLKRAGERMTLEGKENEAKLKALLGPVESTLKRYEEGLANVEKERVGSYRELNKAVELLHLSHGAVKEETARLVNALRSNPKARGRWGEQSLRNVLEHAGLSEGVDFLTEVSVTSEEGRMRPDVIISLPGGRKLVIDAKCSLNAFLDASDAVDDLSRATHMKTHARAIRRHAEQLGSKNYWDQFGDAADYVIMFIPGEHFLNAALEQDPVLWDYAFDRRVLLATPTNLVAIARTVAAVWKQERLAVQSFEIVKLGKELHSRLATMGTHVTKLGRNLELANNAYNSFVGSLESQVLTQARRFEALEVSSGAKEIDAMPLIETSPRPLTKLTPSPTIANEDDAARTN
ncbi:DNA recombination protein RmuC [Sphingomonas sp.]|uniref:DNA recombination protein RmuC n=1 Tax=Sphingomonas sp. TaxID=28214 RepID=UPI0037518396